MVQPAFPEEFDESDETREENLDEWMDMVQEMELNEGDVTASDIVPEDLELAEDSLDDDVLNEYGMHVEELPPDEDES